MQPTTHGIYYSHDESNPPDGSRRGQFKAGWRDAAERGREYRKDMLERLTWHNLGYRLGEVRSAKLRRHRRNL